MDNLTSIDILYLACIYSILSPSGKRYIGQAALLRDDGSEYGLKGRLVDHRKMSDKRNPFALKEEFMAYPDGAFKYKVLAYCHKDEADDYERRYIAQYNTLHPNGLNMTTGGKVIPGILEIYRCFLY